MQIEVNQEFLDRTWTLPIVITVLFGAVGITGNLCVIMVYARYIQRVEERYFILFLAVADSLSVIVASTFFLLLDIYRPFFTSDVLCKSLQFLTWSLNQCSTLIILSLALHRYLKICQPFGPQMTLKWKRIAMIGCFVVAIITSLPLLVFTGTQEILLISDKNTTHNGSFCVVNRDKGNEDGKHYNNFLVFGNLSLFITIVILYVLVGKEIFLRHRRAKQRTTGKSSTDEDKSVRNGQVFQNKSPNRSQIRSKFTTTFFLIIGSYLISYLPLFIIMISKTNNPQEFYSASEWKADMYLIIHRSFILNNVVNPLIYTFFDSIFKKKFQENVAVCDDHDHSQR